MGIASGLASLALLGIIVIVGYTFFSEELDTFFEGLDEKRNESETFSVEEIGNQPKTGDLICDLRVTIPFEIDSTNRQNAALTDFFGGDPSSSIGLIEFIDQQLYVFMGTDKQGFPSWNWSNCYNQGSLSFLSLFPMFNPQSFNERLADFGFMPAGPNTQFSVEQLSLFESGNIEDFQLSLIEERTDNTRSVLTLEGFSLTNQEKKLCSNECDMNAKTKFQRTVFFEDGVQYPILEEAIFDVPNTKVDDYLVDITVKAQPVNGQVLGKPYSFRLCGLDGTLSTGLAGKMSC